MKIFLFIIPLISLNLSIALANETICGPPKPAPSGADELRMEESEFNFKEALKSIEYLESGAITIIEKNENKIFQMIKENNIPQDMPLDMFSVLSNEHFYLSYPNSISKIKGTLLKYRVLYFKEKMKSSNDKKTISSYQKAKEEFCNFVSQAEYVD